MNTYYILLAVFIIIVVIAAILVYANRNGSGLAISRPSIGSAIGAWEEDDYDTIHGGAEEMPSLHTSEPWLSLIISKQKTIEGRPGPESKFSHWVGKEIKLYDARAQRNLDKGLTSEVPKSVIVKVIAVRHYDTVAKYLEKEDWKKIAPHMGSKDEVINAYKLFPGNDEASIARRGGMNAIEIKVVK